MEDLKVLEEPVVVVEVCPDELTEEQKIIVLRTWNENPKNPPSITDLVVAVYGKEYDPRSKQARVIRSYLASRNLQVKTTYYQKKEKIILTEEQKEFISNNCKTLKVVELARKAFEIPDLPQLSQEVRTVREYIGTLNLNQTYSDPEDITDEYRPPNTLERTIARINKYVYSGIDPKKITIGQTKEVKTLMGYLHIYRFLAHIKTYNLVTDRELFESEFVRCCYDKSDLTEEEVDQYIVYSAEVVIAKTVSKRIESFSVLLDETVSGDDKKPNMAFVEAITSLRKEYNECINRQTKLLESLQGKRSERLNKRIKENASILNLVELWKAEDTRKRIIKLGELRKQRLKEDMEKLHSMDELKAAIYGISTEEVVNG